MNLFELIHIFFRPSLGLCNDMNADYMCNCNNTGYEGKNCEKNIDDCASNPCTVGAIVCEDLILDYKCHCYDG